MSNDRPTRATSGGRAYLDLQSLARKSGRGAEDLMRLYALEGLLARLSISRYSAQLILKGGVLLAAYGTRRATRDIDLQARQMANEVNKILIMIQEIAAVATDDGLVFAAEAATARAIRQDDAYQGVRVDLGCSLASARISLHVDVNVGDPIWPGPKPITVPGLLGRDVGLIGYPLTMVYAEKIVTMIERGPTSTRWRDFGDVYALALRHPADGNELVGSLEHVAAFRGAVLLPLSQVLRDWREVPPVAWRAWRRNQLLDGVPVDFADVLTGIIMFADPALTRQALGWTWDPASRSWTVSARTAGSISPARSLSAAPASDPPGIRAQL
jgi:hypothetical protein